MFMPILSDAKRVEPVSSVGQSEWGGVGRPASVGKCRQDKAAGVPDRYAKPHISRHHGVRRELTMADKASDTLNRP